MKNLQQDEHLLDLAVNLQRQPGGYALLLGSGISRAAGIPTAWDITLDLIGKLAAGDGSENLERWYQERYGEEPDYGRVLEQVSSTQAGRRGLLEVYFEPTAEEREQELKLPTPAHKAIAALVGKGYIRMILTTNFDRLMEQALADKGIQATVISSAETIQGATPYVHERVVIVKLNGDYKDASIKNIASELDHYEQPLEQYLDRVLDEFGLIVAGWSGDWDNALCKAILNMPNRRYPLYWLARRNLGTQAQKLVTFRQGRVIQGLDANTFFQAVLNKVEAIEDSTWNSPKTIAALIAETKRYLSQPDRYHIFLEDLVLEEARALAEVMNENHDACPWTLQPSQRKDCIEYLEAKSERLVRILAAITRYDRNEDFVNLIVKAFTLLSNFSKRQHLSKLHDNGEFIRFYPLALSTFAVLIVGTQEGRVKLLRAVQEVVHNRGQSEKDWLLANLLNWMRLPTHKIFNSIFDKEYYVPLSTRIKSILDPWLHEFLVDRNVAFYQGEFVLALATVKAGEDIPWLGIYAYGNESASILTSFLNKSPLWLAELYSPFEELLKTFDQKAQKLVENNDFKSRGQNVFFSRTLAAYRGNELQ